MVLSGFTKMTLSNVNICQYLNKIFSVLSINKEYHIPIERYRDVQGKIKNCKLVLISSKDKYSWTLFKKLGFTIELNDDFAIIKGEFKKTFYKVIL